MVSFSSPIAPVVRFANTAVQATAQVISNSGHEDMIVRPGPWEGPSHSIMLRSACFNALLLTFCLVI